MFGDFDVAAHHREKAGLLAAAALRPRRDDDRPACAAGRFPHVGLFRSYDHKDEAAIEWALESTALRVWRIERFRSSRARTAAAWISAALAQEAGILLLDEPTSFLDIGYQVEVLDLVHRLSREKGVTIVMAIHDIKPGDCHQRPHLAAGERRVALRRGAEGARRKRA